MSESEPPARHRWRKPISLAPWVKRYRTSDLPGDLLAALLVTLMLVPQALAYAALAGLPPQMGLYASILPLIAYALFGSSPVLQMGPVAVISLMTSAALAPLAAPGSADYIAAAVTLSLMSGALLFLFGLLRLGAMAQFLSHPVISGFITGSALLIIIGQLRPLLGIDSGGDNAIQLLTQLFANSTHYQPLVAAIGLAALALMGVARWGLPALLTRLGVPATPAALLAKLTPMAALLLSAALVRLMGWDERVPVVGDFGGDLPGLALPAVDFFLLKSLWLSALAIALIGFVENIAIAKSFSGRRQGRIDPNAELLGLGAANLASGLSGSLPVAGSFSRTAVNAEAGSSTPLSGVIVALLIALVLLFAAGIFSALPTTVLAAIIIVATAHLVDLRSLLDNWHFDRAEGLAQAGTAIGVLMAGVEGGIGIGIGLSLATVVWRASRPHIAIVGRVPDTEHFRNIRRYEVETHRELLIMRVDENLFFGNAEAVEKSLLEALEEQPETRHLVLVMSSVSGIDATALDMLDILNERLMNQGIELHLAEVKGPVLRQLERDHLPERLSGEIFLSTFEAFKTLRTRIAEAEAASTQQNPAGDVQR